MPLQIIRQDITKIACDAIVNPSNEYLLPTGGTDAKIHRTAGQGLFEQCQLLGGCPTGEARITDGFNLPCKYVIHTVGPMWNGGDDGEQELLVSCYRNCLKLAESKKCESIAFPLISSGTYGFPKDKVLKIAINTISEYLFENEMTVYLLVYDKEAYQLSGKLFAGIEDFIDDRYVDNQRRTYSESAYVLAPNSVSESVCFAAEDIADGALQGADLWIEQKDTKSLEDYIIELDEGFAVKLLKLIDAKGMSDVECYKKANVSKQTWYKIMNEKHYKPSKKTVIAFAVALKLTLEETQNLLSSVGFILSNSSLFDVIIMYCLSKGIYDVFEIDAALFKYDQETLFY